MTSDPQGVSGSHSHHTGHAQGQRGSGAWSPPRELWEWQAASSLPRPAAIVVTARPSSRSAPPPPSPGRSQPQPSCRVCLARHSLLLAAWTTPPPLLPLHPGHREQLALSAEPLPPRRPRTMRSFFEGRRKKHDADRPTSPTPGSPPSRLRQVRLPPPSLTCTLTFRLPAPRFRPPTTSASFPPQSRHQ